MEERNFAMATTATMTGAQFDALPYDEGRRWELVRGELIEVSSATPRHQRIVSKINAALEDYFRSRQNAGMYLPDVEFALTAEDRLRPDTCVLLREKADALDLDRVPVPGAPDIAVEVISQSERAGDIQEKLRRYLENGTSEVWQVYPRSRKVEIWDRAGSRTVEADGKITCALLPGLQIPVASIFEL